MGVELGFLFSIHVHLSSHWTANRCERDALHNSVSNFGSNAILGSSYHQYCVEQTAIVSIYTYMYVCMDVYNKIGAIATG